MLRPVQSKKLSPSLQLVRAFLQSYFIQSIDFCVSSITFDIPTNAKNPKVMALNKFTEKPVDNFVINGQSFTCYEMQDWGAGSNKFHNYAFKDANGVFIAKHRSRYWYTAFTEAKKKAIKYAKSLVVNLS